MKKNYVVIVLGLGELSSSYVFLTQNWKRKYNIIPIIYTFGWNNKQEAFNIKFPRLMNTIETLIKKGDNVSLIGISAGASAALNAYIALKKKGIKINKYISVCGR